MLLISDSILDPWQVCAYDIEFTGTFQWLQPCPVLLFKFVVTALIIKDLSLEMIFWIQCSLQTTSLGILPLQSVSLIAWKEWVIVSGSSQFFLLTLQNKKISTCPLQQGFMNCQSITKGTARKQGFSNYPPTHDIGTRGQSKPQEYNGDPLHWFYKIHSWCRPALIKHRSVTDVGWEKTGLIFSISILYLMNDVPQALLLQKPNTSYSILHWKSLLNG